MCNCSDDQSSIKLISRFFWATAVCLAFILSGNLLFKSYVKLNFEPEIGTRSEIMNVRDIPFPSITVCPQTKSKVEFLSFKNIYRDYWQHFKLYGTSDENAARFESLLHVCEPELSYGLELNETKVQTSEEIVKRLKEISYSLDDTMLFCKFRGSFVNCSNLFTEFVTRHGICFSFNFLNFKKAFTDACSETFEPAVATKNVSWRLDEGYETDDLNSYPYPIISQREDALRIILMTKDVDQDYVCAGTSQGFKVYLYLPGDYPGMNGKYLFVPINHDVSAAMNVQVTRTEENLKTYEPKQRKCYLSHERPLKFFRTYSRNYCGLECYANYTLRACGCVHFWMPHDNSTNICDYTQINCTLHAKRNMMLGFKVKDSNEPECDCLPSCTEIRYELESYQTDFDFEKLFESYRYDLSDMPG